VVSPSGRGPGLAPCRGLGPWLRAWRSGFHRRGFPSEATHLSPLISAAVT